MVQGRYFVIGVQGHRRPLRLAPRDVDPTITAPVYFTQLEDGFEYWIDERMFFTPEVQAWVKTKPPRHAVASWDSLYWAMRRTTKAFYDAGGLLTLGTDNPSSGEFIAGFSA